MNLTEYQRDWGVQEMPTWQPMQVHKLTEQDYDHIAAWLTLCVLAILLVVLTDCVPATPNIGVDKLLNCTSCSVQVTRYEANDKGTQWRGDFYTCDVTASSCTCKQTGSTDWMALTGTVTQPYELPTFMNACGIK
jgi:hypothetical protein